MSEENCRKGTKETRFSGDSASKRKKSASKRSAEVNEALNPSRRNNRLIITADYGFRGLRG